LLKSSLRKSENIRSSTPILKRSLKNSVIINSSEESIIELLRDMNCCQGENKSSTVLNQSQRDASNLKATITTKTQISGNNKHNKLQNNKKMKNESCKLSKKASINGDKKSKIKKGSPSQKAEQVNLTASVLQHQNSLLRNDLKVLKNKLENTLQVNKVLNQQNGNLNADLVKIKIELENEKVNTSAKENHFRNETLVIKREVDTALEKIKNLKKDLSSCDKEREKLFKQNLQKDEEVNRLNNLNKQLQSSVERLLADLQENHRHKKDMQEKVMLKLHRPIKSLPEPPNIAHWLSDGGNMRVLYQDRDESCSGNCQVSQSSDNSTTSSCLRDEERNFSDELTMLDEDIAEMQNKLRSFVSL